MADFKILGVSGGTRKGSFNTLALRAAQELAPAGVVIEVCDVSDLPLYDEDLRLAGYPPATQRFRKQVKEADAILFATPEYNYSVSTALKNAIDWASRPPEPPFSGKAVGMVSAATGPMGGVRAQFALRQMLVSLNAFPINNPQVMITFAATKFDEGGRFTDETGRELLQKHIEELVKWGKRLKATV